MNITKKLVETLTWAASSDQQVELPNEGLITRIDLELYTTMSGAVSGDMLTVGLWRMIENLKVEGGGGKAYFGLTGIDMGILLHYLNLRDFPGVTWHDIVATSQYSLWRLHFGSRPRDIWGRDNPFDLTAAIPAQDETNLRLTWTTCGATDTVAPTATVSSATMRVTVHEVLGLPTTGLMVPVSSSESYDPGATKSDLSGERDVPTGSWVRRIAIMALDATAAASDGPLLKDDQMTEVGVKLVKENRRLIEVRAKTLELGNPKWDGMGVANTPNTQDPFSIPGLYCLDLRQYDHPDYGLDARGFNTGDIKLGMTIGAYGSAEKEHIWYDQVQSYPGKGR